MRRFAVSVCLCALIAVGGVGISAAEDSGADIQLQIRGLGNEDSKVRQEAAKALMQMGRAARPAFTALSKALGDEDEVVSYRSAKALTAFGKEAVPVLAEALASSRTSVRTNAADALKEMALRGMDCTAAAPALITCLGDENSRVTTRCSACLVAIGAPAVPALIDALRNADPEVRFGAAAALGKIGRDAASAAPHLAKALQDSNPSVREASASALGKIGPEARKSIQSLAEALGDEDVELRCRVIEVLGDMAVEGGEQDTIVYLVQGLGDESQRVRSRAADSLARAGVKSVRALADALDSQDATLKATAARTLGKMGPDSVGAAGKLASRLSDSDRDVREACAVALQKIGPAGREAVPELIKALGDDDVEIRCKVVDALSAMPPDEPGLVEALIAAFADKSSRVGDRASTAVVRWGRESSPHLAAALSNEDYRINLGAAKALRQIDECPPSAVPQLIAALDSGIVEVRETALVVLGRIGPEARAALPAIRKISESDRSSSVRRRAGEVINLIETQ